MKQLQNTIKRFISIAVGISLLCGIAIGYYYAKMNTPSEKDFDKFRELYHNDYVATIDLFVRECSNLHNNLTIVRTYVDFHSRPLGVVYRCEYPDSNMTLQMRYTSSFYNVELKPKGI